MAACGWLALFALVTGGVCRAAAAGGGAEEWSLNPPLVSGPGLRVLSPRVLEWSRVNLKPADPARIESWDLADASGQLVLPAPAAFTVTVGGQPVAVTRVGFRRRPLYAPLRTRDLRVGNWVYLELASAVEPGQSVELRCQDARLAEPQACWQAAADPARLSPAIHVNQAGYVAGLAKRAFASAFLGTLGELDLAPGGAFELVEAGTGNVVFTGSLSLRRDVGFTMTPLPAQSVWVADFSGFNVPGEYRVRIPALGVSRKFRIGEEAAGALARAYALGLYQQRCGTAIGIPWTRHAHDLCHAAAVSVPTADYAAVARTLADMTSAVNPAQTAPRLSSVDASLYPFVNGGPVEAAGGHHDAGDYSKYTINSAGLIHHLIFAVDAFPGVVELDNLGLPESGNGRSDVLEEAKWEADFLVKLQDADGGFYFLVYPRDRKYENDVLPDHGDPQVVFPKNTSATAAAVAALAQAGSSPAFQAQFPEAAARYRQAALRGWDFLQRALAAHGRAGAYQKISHYGDVFAHDDELAWAAAELFGATGDPAFANELISHYAPDAPATRRWSWWRLFEGYGAAVRAYAFAARSGRVPADRLDAAYLAKCEAELKAAADDAARWSAETAYGTSYPSASKRSRSAGWYFSTYAAFDLAVASQLEPKAAWREALAENLAYTGGANPVDVCFVTGLGSVRQTVIVSQYALNDTRALPPSGLPLGELQTGFPYLDRYHNELSALCLPSDSAATSPYPLYERWGDTWNTSTEAVVMDQARALATTAWLMAGTSLRTQAWQAVPGTVVLTPGATPGSWQCELEVPGLDLDPAQVVWDALEQPVQTGRAVLHAVQRTGLQWVEAEAQWPDGRRVFGRNEFLAAREPDPLLPCVTVTASDAIAAESPVDSGQFLLNRTGDLSVPLTVYYRLEGARNGTDYWWINGAQYTVGSGYVTIPAGAASATLKVTPKPDAAAEGREDVVLTLDPQPAYNVALPHQATVAIYDVLPVNHAPVASSFEAVFDGGAAVALQLTATDADGDDLAFAVVEPPVHGTLSGEPPALLYTPGPGFAGADQFSYVARDGTTESAAATVTVMRDYGRTVGLYPLGEDLAEAWGQFGLLAPSGLARLEAGALRFGALDDRVTATWPAGALGVDAATTAITLEGRVYIDRFLSYSVSTVPLLRLYLGWNCFLELRQDKWARSAMVKAGVTTVATAANLVDVLTPGAWHHVSLRLDQAGYRVSIDGQGVVTLPSADLKNWRLLGPVALEAGHFAGLIDWIEVFVE